MKELMAVKGGVDFLHEPITLSLHMNLEIGSLTHFKGGFVTILWRGL